MQYLRYLRFLFSFRLMAAVALVGLLMMTQAQAWHPYGYVPMPSYPPQASAQFYPPHQGYRKTYYPATRYIQAASSSAAEADLPDKKSLTLAERAQQKLKVLGENISEKKRIFIEKLLPYIERENARIRQIRAQASQIIQDLENRYQISEKSRTWLRELGEKYRVQGDPVEDQEARTELLKRVDIIPASLTLAQAANESAWGKSRFATQANNLFGIWTYDETKGLVPEQRDTRKQHLVRKFEDMGESVRYYMHLLNSHPAYQKLREVRYENRQHQLTPDGHAMAAGLEKYSAKGAVYIQLIRDLIRQNQWAELDLTESSA